MHEGSLLPVDVWDVMSLSCDAVLSKEGWGQIFHSRDRVHSFDMFSKCLDDRPGY